jgi:hypothetical protein
MEKCIALSYSLQVAFSTVSIYINNLRPDQGSDSDPVRMDPHSFELLDPDPGVLMHLNFEDFFIYLYKSF